jgi:hypothetical protein
MQMRTRSQKPCILWHQQAMRERGMEVIKGENDLRNPFSLHFVAPHANVIANVAHIKDLQKPSPAYRGFFGATKNPCTKALSFFSLFAQEEG